RSRLLTKNDPMETRDILLKADRIVVALERLEGGNPSDDKQVGSITRSLAQSGARGGGHWQAGTAGRGGHVGGLSRHRRHRAWWKRVTARQRIDVTRHHGMTASRRNA